MRTEKGKGDVVKAFRAVFALESGGGNIEVKATDKEKAWKILEKIEPKAFQMVKSFEEIGYC